jgi:hypothetical protein
VAEKMPDDPFIPADFTAMGTGAYNMFAALVQAGFSEAYALELTARVTVALLLNSLQAPR